MVEKYKIKVHADEKSLPKFKNAVPATEDDFGREYLDYEFSVKTVKDVDQAIDHITRYSTGHSEAILTKSYERAMKFLEGVDSACVYVNASTRFTENLAREQSLASQRKSFTQGVLWAWMNL